MTAALIDPTARVEPRAVIGPGTQIGPYCVVGPDVVIGDGCRLVAHVHIEGHTTIGARTRIAPFASLGGPPQSTHYRGGPTTLVVGADCDIRENVTINVGTEDGGGTTTVGDRCFIMVGSHIAHDCHIGNNVIFANNAVLGGHVVLGDHVVLGGQVAIHQFVQVGEGAMLAGMSGIAMDVIPFGVALGERARLHGINVIGMKRRNYSRDDIRLVRRAYRMLFNGVATFGERQPLVEKEFGAHPLVAKIFEFIRSPRRRPLMASERSEASDKADEPVS